MANMQVKKIALKSIRWCSVRSDAQGKSFLGAKCTRSNSLMSVCIYIALRRRKRRMLKANDVLRESRFKLPLRFQKRICLHRSAHEYTAGLYLNTHIGMNRLNDNSNIWYASIYFILTYIHMCGWILKKPSLAYFPKVHKSEAVVYKSFYCIDVYTLLYALKCILISLYHSPFI